VPVPDAWILTPTLVVFVLAVISRRPIESLIAGALVGFLMLHGVSFVGAFAESSLEVMTDSDVAWVILVCGFMGSLIALLIRTGATAAFTERLSRLVRSRPSAILATWFLGLLMFVDDYLNSLAVGSSMRDVTDRFGVSREKLAYVVDSTAAPVSVIVPFSTWGVFFAGLLVANEVAAEGEGLAAYIRSIPYMLYAWFAVLLVPLVAFGIIGSIGPMKAAEARALGGQPIPPDAPRIDGVVHATIEGPKGGVALFVLPMALLVGATLYFDKDFLVGIYITLGALGAYVIVRRLLTVHETFDTMLTGFKTMLEPLAVVVAAYILKDVNDSLGLAPYVVSVMTPWLTAESLAAAVFVSMALVSFMTGSNWGVFVIILPIVVALTRELGADLTLIIGATLSASTFGSHACFYSDATVLTAQATGCTPFQHALTQIPYALIAAALSVVGYLLLGFI
jgi:Na+/H+ antiporter NhaC